MSLLDRIKNTLDLLKDSKVQQIKDTRVRVKAVKSVPAIGIEAGNTYFMSPSDASTAHVIGWGEVLDRVPGLNAPLGGAQ